MRALPCEAQERKIQNPNLKSVVCRTLVKVPPSIALSLALPRLLKENSRQLLFPSVVVIHTSFLAARSLVRKPSLGAILFALIPFVAICFSVPLWDRIHPMILGLPFNFFWLITWLLLTPLCMWGAYRQEARRDPGLHGKDGGRP